MTEQRSRFAYETAGALATRDVPIAAPGDRAADVLAGMRGRLFASATVVAVCDGARLAGLVTIERLLDAQGPALMRDIMDDTPMSVLPETDQEHAAQLAQRQPEPALAVVDRRGGFIGLITPEQLLAILLAEHEEDMSRAGGYLHSTEQARSASEERIARRLWHRLPWLACGLAGAIASAGLVGTIEAKITGNLVVAYFIPAIVYLADAVGTQTETLAVRGLSVGIGIRSIARREAVTGLLVGLLLAAVMLPTITLLWGDFAVALAVSIAVLAASTTATLVAMALPWLLQRLGRDPAFGSGPVATVVQDMLSIVIYLAAVSTLIH